MLLWNIGDTSVRYALRLRDGLVALASSPLQGRLRGTRGDNDFRNLLGQNSVVSLREDNTNSVGRKWRSALGKLGFLYPEISRSSGINQADVDQMDTITPNGWRLIKSETVPAMQECFLRALAALFMKNDNSDWFSPLRLTLALLLELEKKTGRASVSFLEMALHVQTIHSSDNLTDIADRIIALRDERSLADSKRRFDSTKYEEAGATAHLQASTIRDYADTNIRYLKATGLVQNHGNGIVLVPEKRLLAELIAKDTTVPTSELEYWRTLCNGANLPTDTEDTARIILCDLVVQLERMEIPYLFENRPVDTAADIAVIRHEIEDLISKQKEEIFAVEQANQWKEIAAYIDLFASKTFGRHKRIDDDTEIIIPKHETPAYLEWIFWRAFLAINNLVNKPYQARRFRVDQNFLPIGPAPGNGPDLIMEFQDFVIAIEVTLTESSRQEAMEGESVRRHVADLVDKYSNENGKPVYGLFIANQIDSNTAETFRNGAWYTRMDNRLNLTIIPMTTAQFGEFFKTLCKTDKMMPQTVISLLEECNLSRSQCDGPEWKNKIENVVQQTVQSFYQ